MLQFLGVVGLAENVSEVMALEIWAVYPSKQVVTSPELLEYRLVILLYLLCRP
jgi:hypothetical protein